MGQSSLHFNRITVLGWVAREGDSETQVVCRRFPGGHSWRHVEGSQQSRTGEMQLNLISHGCRLPQLRRVIPLGKQHPSAQSHSQRESQQRVITVHSPSRRGHLGGTSEHPLNPSLAPLTVQFPYGS